MEGELWDSRGCSVSEVSLIAGKKILFFFGKATFFFGFVLDY